MTLMRRSTLILLASAVGVALAGCTGEERPPADTTATTPAAAPAPVTPPAPGAGMIDMALLGRLAGTWEGRSMPVDRDTVVATWRMTSTADTTGWTITFPDREPIPIRVVAAQGDSVTFEFGPYESTTGRGEQTVRGTARLTGERMVGTYEARPTAQPDSVFRGRTEGTRVP